MYRMNGKLKMRRRRESQISNSLTSENNFARTSHFFVQSTARLPLKMPNFMFCEGRKQAMTKFILFMNLDIVDRNSAPEEFACIWQSKRVGIITIETEKNVSSLFHATFSWLSAVVVSFKNSLIFTQDVTDASVNTCSKLKLVFSEKRL